MRGRWLTAGFLGGVFLFAGVGQAQVPAAPGPEWTAAPGANPAAVAFLDPARGRRAASEFTFLSPDPLEINLTAGYAVPDTGWGAAAVLATDTRTWGSGALDEAWAYSYTWGRRWLPRFGAGATLRWEERRTTLDAGWTTPAESGPGLDLGAIYRPDDLTWVGFAAQDVFDTTLRSATGSATVLPASLQVTVGRQVNPALVLLLEGRDVADATPAGANWRAEARLTRGRLSYHAAVTAGTRPGWSAGLAAGYGSYRFDLAMNGAGARTGGTVGVTARW